MLPSSCADDRSDQIGFQLRRDDSEARGDLTRLHLGSLLLSVVLAVILLVLLVSLADLDLAATGRLLFAVRPQAFAEIVLLMGFNSFLAGEKWRLVVLSLDGGTASDIPRPLYFALSAIGVAFGQVLPVQVGTALCRWLGSRAYGGYAVRRGVAATMFEQLFDVLVAGLIALASLVVIATGSGASAWLSGAAIAITAGFALCGLAAPLAASPARRFGQKWRGRARLAHHVASDGTSRLLSPGLTGRLFALSVLRFVVVVLVAAASADAVSLDIPLWHLAAAFPFGIFATALALTPGGVGIGEWSLASALSALGTPLQVGAQWAVTCRILAILASCVCAAAALVVVGLVRLLGARDALPPYRQPDR
jgi:uncharacterized membrane protein YbhN (UPF0104 family)